MMDMTETSGGIVVTFEKMYDQLQKLVSELHDVNNVMKSLGVASGDHESRLRLLEKNGVPSEDHERRIRSLEKWKYGLPASLLLALASIVITILVRTH